MMQESDTYLMILEEGEEKATKQHILVVGEVRLGPCDEATKARLASIGDLGRLNRMHRRALEANSWQDILDTP